MSKRPRIRNKKRAAALVSSIIILSLLAVASTSYINSSTQTLRISSRQTREVITTNLCEAGVQDVLRELWRPFKINQTFTDMDQVCGTASANNPKAAQLGELTGSGKYSAAVIGYTTPGGDSYRRIVQVRAVGWIDTNDNDVVDEGEARKTVDVSAQYELARSQVFDYTYFVNNYGWFDGFRESDLIINGDLRANANLDFLNGSPTINGSIHASVNDKLVPAAVGLINTAPVKMSNGTYQSRYGNNPRVRQVYNASNHGAKGTPTYENNRDFVFDSDGGMVNGRAAGATLNDSTGTRAWTRTATGNTVTQAMLDTTSTKEVVMPDLSDITKYQTQSQNYINTRATFADGTPDPNHGQGAFVEVWQDDSRGGRYVRVSTNGVISGSVMLIGSSTRPIRIHGPVTVTQDVVIRGVVEGQGTLYAGRNVHVVGSVTYRNGPDFRGANQTTVDNANEKRDFLGLAARASVIFGNPREFSNPYPLRYMTPPFTKGRYAEDGTYIPPYNALERDATGMMRYQSTFGDEALNRVATGVNQIDAIIYTNFVGGGNLGRGGGGVQFNGTIISRDEAMVIWSLPIVQNYDNRIRERVLSQKPLIDLSLPRSPVMLRSTWQDRGFKTTNSY